MPHISKNKLAKETLGDLEDIFLKLIQDSGRLSRIKIFRELLTKTERMMMAKRLGIILLLKKGMSTYDISRILKVSPSTVTRFEFAIENNVYRSSSEWLKKFTKAGRVEKMIATLFELALNGRKRSFSKMVDDM